MFVVYVNKLDQYGYMLIVLAFRSLPAVRDTSEIFSFFGNRTRGGPCPAGEIPPSPELC